MLINSVFLVIIFVVNEVFFFVVNEVFFSEALTEHEDESNITHHSPTYSILDRTVLSHF
jgi:hypothetical protein